MSLNKIVDQWEALSREKRVDDVPAVLMYTSLVNLIGQTFKVDESRGLLDLLTGAYLKKFSNADGDSAMQVPELLYQLKNSVKPEEGKPILESYLKLLDSQKWVLPEIFADSLQSFFSNPQTQCAWKFEK